jgi:hypothetical protein
MAVPNPYFIYIELFKADGVTRPNQNEIARVRAYDVNGGVVTWEGESGFNPNTGGWYPVYMQNIAAFYPPREKPNLKFEVWNTQEQLVHTTQVFSAIPCASTVKIVIGVSDEIVGGGGSTTWVATGTVKHEDQSVLGSGTVRVYDITNGSEKELANTTLGADGTYSVSFTTADFTNNGGTHTQPNLKARVFDSDNQLLGESALASPATNPQILDVTVPNEPPPGPNDGKRRVFGNVKNSLGLAVSGILVEAYHVGWTIQGLQEFRLGSDTPRTSGSGGEYEIFYDPAVVGTPSNPCGTPAGQVNLIVYAKEAVEGGTPKVLFTSPIVFDAPAEQRVDLEVNKTAVGGDSEYERLDQALTPCLGEGETEAAKWAALNQLNERPEYLTFVSQVSGLDETLLRAYVRAWIIAGEINAQVPGTDLGRPMSPEVIYGLLRVREATTLAELLNIPPEQFFDSIVLAIQRGIVSPALEKSLYPGEPTDEFHGKSLLDDWRLVLARLLGAAGASWQADLLNLVFPDSNTFPQVAASLGQAFGTAGTSHAVLLPGGIAAGDLLLVLFANRAGSGAPGTVTAPADWQMIWSQPSPGAGPVRFSAYLKQATGTEGGASVNFVTSSSNQASAQIYRIAAGTWSGDPTLGKGHDYSATAGTGTSVDPPLLSPSNWVAGSHLWLACAAHMREFALTGSPADYVPNPAFRTNSSTTVGNCTVLSATRQLAAHDENPGAFTIQSSADWVAVSIVVAQGTVSQADKREAVVSAHFDHQGSFAELIASLLDNDVISDPEAQNLTFVFELYDLVGRYYPIVAAVYARKADMGWTTVSDLTQVPLDGDPHGEDWYHYALAQLSYSEGTFPADVPGNNSDDRAHVYAARLFDLFHETAPQQSFATQITASAGSDPVMQELATFLGTATDFDLDRTNVDQYLAAHPDALSPEAQAKLKPLQRVYRLTSDFDAANAMLTATPPLDSAVKIARMQEGDFVAAFEEQLGGLTAARDIYRTAAHYASEVLFTLVKYHQNLNEVGGMAAVPGAVELSALASTASAVLDPTEGLVTVNETGEPDASKFPTWVTLFGSLNQCACKECQTILSPGAYMVDLLEFVDGAPKRTLFDRRPDLEDIEITCTNTNTTLPYIDLVNEVLEAIVEPLRFVLSFGAGVDVEQVLDQASGKGAPEEVEPAFEQVDGALAAQGYMLTERAVVKTGAADGQNGREWVVEDDAWRFSIRQTGTAVFTVFPSRQTSANNDSLEVFPEHVNVKAYENKLSQALFPFNLPLEFGREESEIFLGAKNALRHRLLEAFTTKTSEQKREDVAVALAYLKLTSNEAAAILGQITPIYLLWGFTSATPSIPRPDKPTFQLNGNWVDVMALVPVFLHRSGLSYQELLELLDTEFVHRYAATPANEDAPHGLHLAGPSDSLSECDVNEFQIAHLTEAVLQRISFFVRLWRKLGWTMRELDRYLVELEGNDIPALDAGSSELGGRLLRVSHVGRLMGELKLGPRTVVAFFRPMDRRRTERNPKSLFDEVYLVGSPTQLEVQALEAVALGGYLDLTSRPAGEDLKTHVRASLRLKSEDAELLWQHFVLDAAEPTKLDLEKLTGMYRVATLAAALKVSVTELFDLEHLIGMNVLPDGSVDDANLRAAILGSFAALEEIRTARLVKMPAAEMTYYLTDEHEEDDSFAVSKADLEAAVQRLAAASASIAAANPDQPNLDSAVLGTALAKVMPANQVVRAITAVEGPPPPPDPADFPDPPGGYQDALDAYNADIEKTRAFLVRYFAPFLPSDATEQTAFLEHLVKYKTDPNLTPEQDRADRYADVYKHLHDYLLEQARTTTAITVAAEVTQTDEDRANTLLTLSLSSVADATRPALDDWKKALAGGWSTGEETLVDAPPASERHGTFVAAAAGDHRFVASIAPTTGATVTITIEVDGDTVTLEQEPPTVTLSDHIEVTFKPVTLRAGGAYPMTVVFTGPTGAKLTLLARVGNDDPVIVPSSAVITFDSAAYVKLFKAARLSKGLTLTKLELRYLVENPSAFDFDLLPKNATDADVPWPALSSLIALLDLNRGTKLKQGTLFEFWRDTVPTFTDPAAATAAVAVATGFMEDDLKVLRGEDPSVVGLWAPAPAPAYDEPGLWFVLRDCFELIGRLDLRARQILELLVRSEPTIASAVLLRSIFRAQFSRDAWKEIFKPLRDPLRQRQRDALVGYLTTGAITLPDGSSATFIDANDLFSFFLIDVQIETDTLISRIKLALNVIQLFVHRVFLGLEDPDSLNELEQKKELWTWMDKYRVWEANRKVFLYPENWIEPELRDDKTEFFTELEDELVQGPLSHETAMQALASYLEKMSEVSNLEVVGSFAEGSPGDGTNYTLHIVGRTRSRSRGLFYRTFHGKQAYDGYFTPWRRINLEIDADVIAPVVVNGKLHLFWPKIATKERPREHDFDTEGSEVKGSNKEDFQASKRMEYLAQVQLMWSEFNAKQNKWGKPKLTKSSGFDNDAPTPFQREMGEDKARTENYHLRVHLEPMHIAVDLVKTNVPTEGRTIVFKTEPVNFYRTQPTRVLFWTFYLPVPEVLDTALLDPKILGTFRIWDSGDDGFDVNGAATGFGDNYPIGTVLKSNAAHEVTFSVDNKVANDMLQLGTSVPFLDKTPDLFRIYETNFNYALGADKQPFFYETNLKSLFALPKPDVTAPSLSQQKTAVVRFSTFNHPLVLVFQKELQYHGLEGLMNRLVEALPVADDRYYSSYYYDYYYGSLYLGYHIAGDYRSLYTTQRIFESEHAPGAQSVQGLYPLPTVEFGYGSSFGIYNWELFFHVPMLIATRLGQDLKFEDALRWYHGVFDPKQKLNNYERTRSWVPSLPPGCRYWNFLPFFANRKAEDSLLDTLGLTDKLSQYDREQLSALIDEWRHNPFNPHLVARQRISAYQKFTVMKYLDNLIAWADSLFRQDTFETINEATQLYVLADELLGQRPAEVDSLLGEPRLTYRELRAKGIDEFSDAIVEVESLIVSNQPYLRDTTLPQFGAGMTMAKNIALKSFYFRIPRNERLDGYWDIVQDRLFKIRNSMNIDGVKRQLALFEPPIEPGLLVRAAAAGLDIGSVLAQLNTPPPCYRFSVWVQKATELTSELKGFGAALLAALEKKDAEALARLRQEQELEMLGLVRKVREQQVKEADENIKALELSRALAEERRDYYRTRSRISQGEQTQIDKTKTATIYETAQGAAHALSALFAPVPDSKAGMVGPFPSGLIDLKIGTALQSVANAAAGVAGALASFTRGEATIAGLRAGYDRRWEDWKLQERLADKEIDQLNQQIIVAAIRLDIAEKELANHEKQIEHSQAVLEFLEDKFTSRELYTWMIGELSRTYNQLYKLAYDAARTAERTYEFELGTTDSGFIQFGYIDSLHQGLLAGEKLMHDIKRMEVAYYERHKRELEIQKPISLAAFDAAALQDLRENGACNFELPEVLFDLDFPGHYFRRIKGVRLTVPCVTGPHTSVSAKLSLLGSAYRKDAGVGANGYPYIGFDDGRFVHDPVGITSIAAGRAQADPGLFEFNFRDERYLPFEGAGAVSRWRLELPTEFRQFDYNTISDVVIEMSYTARDAGGLLKVAAEGAIVDGLNSIRELATTDLAEATGLVRVFSLKKEFPDTFHRLLTEQSGTATIAPEHFPFVIRQAQLAMTSEDKIDIHVVPKAGVDIDSLGATVTLNGQSGNLAKAGSGVGVTSVDRTNPTLLGGWSAEQWTFDQTGLTTSTVEDIVSIVRYTVA